MRLVESIDAFAYDFGEAATLPSMAVAMGNFINEAKTGGVLGIAASEPTFYGKTSDLSALIYGDVINIGSTSYTVRAIEPDDTGMTTLILART